MATTSAARSMSAKNALMAMIHKVDGEMMNEKLRAAAQAALEWLETSKKQSIKEYLQVVDGLKDALAEPAIKESLTTAERKPVPEFELIEKWEGE
jgi:arginine utilization protein RocB